MTMPKLCKQKSNMAYYVPSDCEVLTVIAWLPRDDTLPGFVVLTFLGFFVVGAVLALIVVRCAAREVEIKRRKETSISAARDPSKDVWIFGYKVYVAVVLVLIFFFLINLLVVQIMFAAKDGGEKKRSEKHMSENFSHSFWLWAILAAFVLLPIFGFLALRCIMFPGMLKRKYKEHKRKRKAKKNEAKTSQKEQIVLVHIDQRSSEQEDKKRSKTILSQNKVFPLPQSDEEGDAASKATSLTSLRSGANLAKKDSAEQHQYGLSIIEILTKTSSEQMEVELQGQDLKSVIEMEDNLLKQKSETFVNIWRMILDVLFHNGRISEIYRRESIARLEQAVDDIHQGNELGQDKEGERLRSEIEDPAKLEEALEELHAFYSKKTVLDLTNLQHSAANDLKEKSQLSEEEANAIVMKVQSNLAASEKFFVDEQTRQSMALQEKFLRRQALVQLRDQMNDQEKQAIENLPNRHREAFHKLCENNQNLESQKDEILSEFQQNLARLQENHERAVLAQQNKLALKLGQRRAERIQRLSLRQQREKEEHYKQTCRQVSEGKLDMEAFVKEQTELKRKHTLEREDEHDQADKTEAEKLERLRQYLDEERQTKIQSYEEHLVKKMATMVQLSYDDVHQFMDEHRRDMALYNEKLEESKSHQRSQLKERIHARRAKLDRERAQHKNEQMQLITQQEEVIDQVLKMQIGLTEEARKHVMVEHEQNLMILNNHLQITRLRQQKRLEERLARRKAKLAEMKKAQAEELSKSDPDKLDFLAKLQNKTYEAEIKKLENEHDKALEDLRRRLALETEEALREQDKRLGEILGKHQIGVARRDEIIRRQNETIKAIEEKIVDKLTTEGTFAENSTDKILKQHQRQILNLETKISQTKKDQERNLYQKLEAKRLKKERALSAEINDKVEEQKQRGVRSAARIMMTALAQTQLKHGLEELRREMEMEFSKQKEELNRTMDEKLMEELQSHEENFITQLASISHMNEQEIAKICKEAVVESGGDQRTSRRLSKDLRKRIRINNEKNV